MTCRVKLQPRSSRRLGNDDVRFQCVSRVENRVATPNGSDPLKRCPLRIARSRRCVVCHNAIVLRRMERRIMRRWPWSEVSRS